MGDACMCTLMATARGQEELAFVGTVSRAVSRSRRRGASSCPPTAHVPTHPRSSSTNCTQEFLKPSELRAFVRDGALPAVHGKCLVCLRFYTTRLVAQLRSDAELRRACSEAGPSSAARLVMSHANMIDCAEGYARSAVMFPETCLVGQDDALLHLTCRPFVRYDSSAYVYARAGGANCSLALGTSAHRCMCAPWHANVDFCNCRQPGKGTEYLVQQGVASPLNEQPPSADAGSLRVRAWPHAVCSALSSRWFTRSGHTDSGGDRCSPKRQLKAAMHGAAIPEHCVRPVPMDRELRSAVKILVASSEVSLRLNPCARVCAHFAPPADWQAWRFVRCKVVRFLWQGSLAEGRMLASNLLFSRPQTCKTLADRLRLRGCGAAVCSPADGRIDVLRARIFVGGALESAVCRRSEASAADCRRTQLTSYAVSVWTSMHAAHLLISGGDRDLEPGRNPSPMLVPCHSSEHGTAEIAQQSESGALPRRQLHVINYFARRHDNRHACWTALGGSSAGTDGALSSSPDPGTSRILRQLLSSTMSGLNPSVTPTQRPHWWTRCMVGTLARHELARSSSLGRFAPAVRCAQRTRPSTRRQKSAAPLATMHRCLLASRHRITAAAMSMQPSGP